MTDITSTPATSVADDPLAFYVRLGEPTVDADGVRTSRVRSTVHAQGAWREEEMHMAAVSGLLLHEVAAHETTPGCGWDGSPTTSWARSGRASSRWSRAPCVRAGPSSSSSPCSTPGAAPC